MADDRTAVPEDETPSGPAPAAPPAAEPTEDWATRFKYLLADFENFRRRSDRERESVTRQARAALLRELLPILEGFRTAHGTLDAMAPADPLRRGFELLEHEWATFLKREGVEPVAKVGAPFRADEAEAVAETAARDDLPDGSVAEIVQQGYRFFGGLLRPAKVVVARAAPAAPVPSAVEADPSGAKP